MRASIVAAVLSLAGCAGLQDLARGALERPTLTFRSASLQALDLEGATVGFTFDLENPNGFGVDVARIGWNVEVEGTRIAGGELPGGLAVRARATAPVTFPVRVRFQDVPGIVSLLRGGRDELAYRLSGAIGVKTPVGVVDLPLSHSDRVQLPDLPRFGLDGLSVRQVSLTSVAFDVRVRVDNPNRFALPPGQLDYALSVGGQPVARAEGAALAPVAAGASAVLAIPVRVELASAGRAASQLIQGGEVMVGLTGKADVAGLPLPLELSARVTARR
jgi:LEA14-like dessication related protein